MNEVFPPARNMRRNLLALAPFGLALAFWWARPVIMLDPDTPRYLANDPMRTATYPLFLDIVPGPALLPVQLFLFAAALSWLAFYASRFLPWIVCAAVVLAIAANPYVWQLQGSIMSEALTIPLLTVMVGCLVAFCATGRPALIIAVAVLGGIATSIRPPLLPFIIAPLCAVWITTERRVRLSLLVLLAWAMPVAAERIYSHAVHGSQLTSPLGRAVFMKAAVIDAPAQVSQSDQRLVTYLNDDYAPVRRLIDKTSDPDVRDIVQSNYEACAAYGCLMSVIEPVDEAEFHRHLARVGVARLSANPVGYIGLAVADYRRLWLLHPRKVPALASKYNAFLAREAPIRFAAQLGELARPTPAGEQKQMYRFERAAFALIGLLAAAMTIGFAFWRPNPLVRAAFALLLGTQAVLVFGAFLGTGQPRYTMGMWPALIAGELLGLAGLLTAWRLDPTKAPA